MSPSAKADHLRDKLISRGGVDPESLGMQNAFQALPSLSKQNCGTTTLDLRSSFIHELVACLIRSIILIDTYLSGVWFWVRSNNSHSTRHVFKRNLITCSTFIHHCKTNKQHNGGGGGGSNIDLNDHHTCTFDDRD